MKLYVMVETASSETGGSTPNIPLSTSSLIGGKMPNPLNQFVISNIFFKTSASKAGFTEGDNLESTECIPTKNVSSAKVVPSIYISSNPIRHKGIA